MIVRVKQLQSVLGLILIAGGIAACSDDVSGTDDQFARDLKLASSTVDLASLGVDSALLVNLENTPTASPEAAKTVVRGSGDRAVRSRTPTVRARPVEEMAAEESEAEIVETLAEAPEPEEITEPIAVAPRPTEPVIVQTGGAGGAGDYGTGGGGVFGGGIFGGSGGGVVIRGGGVDGDNCELHRRGGTRRGPIYLPRPIAELPTRPTTPTVSRPASPRIGLGDARRAGGRRPTTIGRVPTRSGVESDRVRPARPTRTRSPRIGG